MMSWCIPASMVVASLVLQTWALAPVEAPGEHQESVCALQAKTGTSSRRLKGNPVNSAPCDNLVITLSAEVISGTGRLLVSASPVGQPTQSLTLDTGSSTVGFLLTSAPESAHTTPFSACEVYGGPINSSMFFSNGFTGLFFNGSLQVSGMDSVSSYYAWIQEGPYLAQPIGIFGIAYKARNQAYFQNEIGAAVVSDTVIYCPANPSVIVTPLIQELTACDNAQPVIGIYWSGEFGGSSQGALYLGASATSNEHYAASPVQKAQLLPGQNGWYNVNVVRISINGKNFSGFGCNSNSVACILDTGTPPILLPSSIPQAVINSPGSSLQFELAGFGSSGPVLLNFNLDQLRKEHLIFPFSSGPIDMYQPAMVIGLPLWAQYYTAWDLNENSAAFVST